MLEKWLPETADMQAFVACVEQASFSSAARVLGAPRQTVTRRVERLEAQLGMALLRRSQQDFQVTDTGHAMYLTIKEALLKVDSLLDCAHEASSVLRGKLRITVMPLEWGPLRQMIHDFRAKNPDVQIEVLSTTRYVDLVQEEFDLAIRGGTHFDNGLVARKLGTVKHLVMASPQYLLDKGTPTRLDDIALHQIIGSYSDDGVTETQWPLQRGGHYNVKPSFSSNDLVMRRDAAILGHGIAMLPDLAVMDALRCGTLVPVLSDVIGSDATFAAVYLPTRLMRPVVRSFIDFAVDWVRMQTRWLGH